GGRALPVEHIRTESRRDVHSPTPFAQIQNNRVVYPQAEAEVQRKKAAAAQPELRFDDSEPAMPVTKRKTYFTAAKEARGRARLSAGTPPMERVIPDKRRKPPKHKKSLGDLAEI